MWHVAWRMLLLGLVTVALRWQRKACLAEIEARKRRAVLTAVANPREVLAHAAVARVALMRCLEQQRRVGPVAYFIPRLAADSTADV